MSLQVSPDGRFYVHRLPWNPPAVDQVSLSVQEQRDIREKLEKIITILERKYPSTTRFKDSAIYTGQSGVAAFYLHLHRVHPESRQRNFLKKATEHLEHPTDGHIDHISSFLDGTAGVHAIQVLKYTASGDMGKARASAKEYLDILPEVLSYRSNEFIYGKAGYLYGAILVNQALKEKFIPAASLKQLGVSIVEAGRTGGRENTPLYYEWHQKPYVGAAHGVAGILYVLMNCPEVLGDGAQYFMIKLNNYSRDNDALDDSDDPSVRLDIKNTLDSLTTQRYPSGNFISSVGSVKDKLVQWCHGSPGVIPTLCKGYELYGDRRYIDLAETCSEDVWTRGLLTKGTGLCHGIGGNAYSFISLYHTTKNKKYLHRAYQFVLFACSLQTESNADNPYSLFEGIAGFGYLLADILWNLQAAHFPCYEF